MATLVTTVPAERNVMATVPEMKFEGSKRVRVRELAHHTPSKAGIRVALYSHDTMGLGHLRRNLLIADSLASSSLWASSLLITGAHEANFFRLPDRADCMTLPRMHKSAIGNYASGNLQLSLRDLARLRGRSICSALEVFQPDLFIVDKVPTGAADELLPALRMLASRGQTICVLGIRDVLDDPATVAREWLNEVNRQVIERYFREIWIYGDARVFDPIKEYSIPREIARRVKFTGYLDQTSRQPSGNNASDARLAQFTGDQPLIACVLGGGQDGFSVATTFVRALPRHGVTGVVLTGPFMPAADRAALCQLASINPNLHVLDFLPEADALIERADRVVAMAGYNTVCSLLSFGKKALLIPRITPRSEQSIRAERLERLGLVDVMLPHNLSPTSMRQWMIEDVRQSVRAMDHLDFGGLHRLVTLTHDLLTSDVNSR
jgi:predicted glycosyltransferase